MATPPWRAGLGGAAAAGGAGSTKNGNNTRSACPIGPVGVRHARGALDKYKDAAGVHGRLRPSRSRSRSSATCFPGHGTVSLRHYARGARWWRAGEGGGYVLWSYPPRLRPLLAIVVKRRFSRDVFSYLEFMEMGEDRTKMISVGIFYNHTLPTPPTCAHNSFWIKSYACQFVGKLLVSSTI